MDGRQNGEREDGEGSRGRPLIKQRLAVLGGAWTKRWGESGGTSRHTITVTVLLEKASRVPSRHVAHQEKGIQSKTLKCMTLVWRKSYAFIGLCRYDYT